MKRTLLLAGCLVLCAGCAKKVAPQPIQDPTQPTDGIEMNVCVDQEGHWVTCPEERPKPQSKHLPGGVTGVIAVGDSPDDCCGVGHADASSWVIPVSSGGARLPMVAPTMRDVVTHSQQWGCDDGYKQWWLTDGTANNFYEVCVTPEFIAELKKAKGEK